MLHPLTALPHQNILSLRHGGAIAQITDIIIDPRNLHIVALHVSGDTVPEHEPVVDTSDIRESSPRGLIIDSEDQIHELPDLIRLSKIADENFRLLAMPVYLETGSKIGKIIDATFHPDTFYIHQLIVQPTWWRALWQSTSIVSRTQIVSITPRAVVIKQATIRDESEEVARHPAHAATAK